MSYTDHLNTDRAYLIYVKVQKLLQSKKLYRDPTITARRLAEMIDEDSRSVSAAIAIQSGEDFLTHLSCLRVREACRLLRDPRFATWSAERIGLRSGFASRQSFYLAFKRIMGATPTQYRKLPLSQ